MHIATSGWVLLGIFVAALLWTSVIYNRLRARYRRVEAAYALIDVQLCRRCALIPALVELVRSALPQERATLEAALRACRHAMGAAETARRHPGQPGAMGALAVAEQALGDQLDALMRLAVGSPVLQADTRLPPLADAMGSARDGIVQTRQAYNAQVQAYNRQAGRWPGVIVARIMGFARLDVLSAPVDAHDRTDLVAHF